MKLREALNRKRASKELVQKKVKERKANCWTEDDIQEALHKLKSVPGCKIRTVASEYDVNESTGKCQ